MNIRQKEHWLHRSYKIVPLIKNEEGNYTANHHADKATVAAYDFPSWIDRKHTRFWDAIHAQLIRQYPRFRVEVHVAGYSIHDGKTESLQRDFTIRALKGQVTKYENIIRNYESERKKELFWEPEHDEQYQKALAKLAAKRKKLKQAINEKSGG